MKRTIIVAILAAVTSTAALAASDNKLGDRNSHCDKTAPKIFCKM
jgi:hypothetical protein